MNDHAASFATRGQTLITDETEVEGDFSGLLVIVQGAVTGMSWQSGYKARVGKSDSETEGDWSDFAALPPGFYPGRFSAITGDGTLQAIAIHA